MRLSTNYITLATLLCALSASAAPRTRRATVCNGHAELCDRSFGGVTFVGTHNSYAVGTASNVGANQDYDITQQLNDGVRMLQSQAHEQNGVIQLCHSTCFLLNGGTLQDYLTKVKTWMDANPNEVVSLLIVNSDNLPASRFDAVFKAAGVDTISYAPEAPTLPATGWPTLGSLIDSNKRLLTFFTGPADFQTVPYLIDEFSNMWETAYDATDISQFNCEVNRTRGDATTQLYLVNHSLDKIVAGFAAPDASRAAATNAVSGPGSLGERMQQCNTQHGRNPNFLLVDWYEYGGGSVFQVAATANGVTYNPTTPVPQPKTGAGTGPASNTTTNRDNVTTTPSGGPRGVAGSHAQLVASLAAAGGMALASLLL